MPSTGTPRQAGLPQEPSGSSITSGEGAWLTTSTGDRLLDAAVAPLVEEVRSGAGFMAGVQLRNDVSGDVVAGWCTDAGVLIRTIHNNTLQVCPPFVTTDDEIALIATTITQALDAHQP